MRASVGLLEVGDLGVEAVEGSCGEEPREDTGEESDGGIEWLLRGSPGERPWVEEGVRLYGLFEILGVACDSLGGGEVRGGVLGTLSLVFGLLTAFHEVFALLDSAVFLGVAMARGLYITTSNFMKRRAQSRGRRGYYLESSNSR